MFVQGAKVGLYFINREEWVITEQACNSYAFVSVPLYDTLGKEKPPPCPLACERFAQVLLKSYSRCQKSLSVLC